MSRTETPPAPAAMPAEPAWDRAARILSGDVRPGDYLPETPLVTARVARDLEHARARGKAFGFEGEFSPEVERRQRDAWLLVAHHPGEHVAYLQDDTGVVVVMTGLDEIGQILDQYPYEQWQNVKFGYVDPE